jgi:acetate---CoA ligase (ADP-forming)
MFRSVETVLRAKSIAMVGASERAPWARIMYRNLRDNGYPGRLVLINPRQKEVFGEPCVPTLRDVAEPVEHAMVIVPAPAVAGILTDADATGIKTATIYSAAMGDGPDPESHKRGAWLTDFLTKSNIKVAGPNCMGAYSYREKVFAYPNLELCKFPAGSVGAVFQSGGTLQFWLRSAADRGLRFSYGITSGNEVSFDLADYVNFLVDDPHTKVIVMFIEGIRRPDAFMTAAGRALEAGKPMVAIKTGVTAKSQAAAQSHTGAIGGDYAAYLAMCERYGIVNCRNLDDMMECTLAFDGGRLPKGPRIGFVTTSGGTVDLLYDYAEAEGSPMPDYSPETLEGLMPYMQEGIEPKNPLDLGIPGGLKQAAGVCAVVANDSNVDMVGWAAMLPGKAGAWDGVEALQAMVKGTDKPVVGFGRMSYQMTPDMVAAQEAAGFPFLQGLEPTLRAMNGLWFHASRAGKRPPVPPPAPPSDLSAETLDAALRRYGIVLPQTREVASAADAAAAAKAIGFPVALKIRSPDILHKTEAGGVMLGLNSTDAVQQAADRLVASARAAYPNARIEGFLVQEMVSGIEAIIGARTDPIYGPLILVGAGGILVELAKDAALRLLPVTEDDVRSMIEGLKLNRLLAGYRGKPPADRTAFASSVLGLARFFLDHRSRIEDIEINPLMVRPDGQGAIAVDVRVIWKNDKGGQ